MFVLLNFNQIADGKLDHSYDKKFYLFIIFKILNRVLILWEIFYILKKLLLILYSLQPNKKFQKISFKSLVLHCNMSIRKLLPPLIASPTQLCYQLIILLSINIYEDILSV